MLPRYLTVFVVTVLKAYFFPSALQLEAAGLWQWAAYVLLHLGDAEEIAIELIARHIPHPGTKEQKEAFEFLTKNLGIPDQLLYQALVIAPLQTNLVTKEMLI